MKIYSIALCDIAKGKPIAIVESNQQWRRVLEDIPKYKLVSTTYMSYFEGNDKLVVYTNNDWSLYLLLSQHDSIAEHFQN